MRLLVSWVRDFVDVTASPDAIAETLAVRGFEVATIEPAPAGVRPPWAQGADGPDAVIDFEVTANRPDCLSVVGFAREIATAFELPFRTPVPAAPPSTDALTGTPVDVRIEDTEQCPRYAAAVADVRAATSPTWMTARLLAAGVRPISPFVDITNYVLMELGHPMHAFDVATLRGVTRCVYAMPDVHEGYGFPVGGVAATRASDGVISPGGVGYDINCGVRLLISDLDESAVRPHLAALVHELSRSIPSGTGRGGRLSLSDADLDRVLAEGCRYLLERELAVPEDLETIEAGGALVRADPGAVSSRAKMRGRDQLGTLGSGNHFIEVQTVEDVIDPAAARVYGVERGRIAVLIHTGSRGLGHQVCTDYVRLMDKVMPQYGITLPDRELACAPFASPEGQRQQDRWSHGRHAEDQERGRRPSEPYTNVQQGVKQCVSRIS